MKRRRRLIWGAVIVVTVVLPVLGLALAWALVPPATRLPELALGLWFWEAIWFGCRAGACLAPVLAFSLGAVPVLRRIGRWSVHSALAASAWGAVASVVMFLCLWGIQVVLDMTHHIFTPAESLAAVLPSLAAAVAVVAALTSDSVQAGQAKGDAGEAKGR